MCLIVTHCLKMECHLAAAVIRSVRGLGQYLTAHALTEAIDKEKLPQLGYTTGCNSYWLANVARLLDAILTPGQRIERDLSYGRSCDGKNDILTILQNVTVTDTRHTCHRHSSPTLVTNIRHRHHHRHQHQPHL